MADNTKLKELQADMKRLLEMMEKCDVQYAKRDEDYVARFERIESVLDTLSQIKAIGGSTSNSAVNNPQPFQVRNIKLDFPRFDGSDVLHWIFKVEQFFDYYNTLDAQCLTIAGIHMDKDVVPWFQMMSRTHPSSLGRDLPEHWSLNLALHPTNVPVQHCLN